MWTCKSRYAEAIEVALCPVEFTVLRLTAAGSDRLCKVSLWSHKLTLWSD